MNLDYRPFHLLSGFNTEFFELSEELYLLISDDLKEDEELFISIAFAFIFNRILGFIEGFRDIDQDYILEEALERKFTDEEWDKVWQIIDKIASLLISKIGEDGIYNKIAKLFEKEDDYEQIFINLSSEETSNIFSYISGKFRW
jgi:hypothetical protein